MDEFETNDQIRAAIVEVCHALVAKGHLIGSSGNVSHRGIDENTLLITPSSVDYDEMQPGDVLLLDLEGNILEGSRNASVEKDMHIAAYQHRDSIHAVLHTHAKYSTMMSILRWDLPPAILEEFIIYVGMGVQVAEYGPAGSDELAENAIAALGKKTNAVFLQNHGNLVVGKDFRRAMRTLNLVERAAEIYLGLKALGDVPLAELPEDTIDDEKDMYKFMTR